MVGNCSPFFYYSNMTVREALRRVKEFVEEMPIIVEQIGDELAPGIVTMNQEQLSKGITSEGEMIGDKPPYNHPGYFEGHKEHREEMGLQTNHIDLKVTGKFYNSLFPEFRGPLFNVLSNDNKDKVYALMYGGESGDFSICGCRSVRDGGFGEEILGLTDENASEIESKGTQMFLEKFKEKTGF